MTPIPLTPYSTDSDERDRIAYALAVFSVLVAFVVHVATEPLHWEYGWVLDLPSAGVVYGALRAWFSKKLWRAAVLRRIGVVKIPNLNGRWKGEFRSSYDSFGLLRTCDVEIKQDWDTISIIFAAGNSESVSIMSGISVRNATGPQLSYVYVNRAHYNKNLLGHEGTQCLVLSVADGVPTLSGEYFTNRKDGQTHGRLSLQRADE